MRIRPLCHLSTQERAQRIDTGKMVKTAMRGDGKNCPDVFWTSPDACMGEIWLFTQSGPHMITVEKACEHDIHAIHEIVQAAFAREAVRVNNWKIAPLVESESDIRALIGKITILVAKEEGAIVGTGRATPDGDTVRIGRLAVRPDRQRRGIASKIVRELEAAHPAAARFEIFTSETSLDNIALYNKLGYAIYDRRKGPDGTALVFMEKRRPAK